MKRAIVFFKVIIGPYSIEFAKEFRATHFQNTIKPLEMASCNLDNLSLISQEFASLNNNIRYGWGWRLIDFTSNSTVYIEAEN